MGDKIEVKLDKRTVHGKKVARLREEGQVPAIVYGPEVEPVAVQADHRVIDKIIEDAGYHTPVYLMIDGSKKKQIAMIKDIAYDPVKDAVQHISFHAVRQNQPVVAEIPIVLVGEGESEAERNGLVVMQSLESIEARALPTELPESFEADIRNLAEVGDRLTVGDLTIPEGVELVEREVAHEEDDEEGEEASHSITEYLVVNVYDPEALEAANESAAGDAEEGDEVEADNGGEDEGAESEAESENKE